MTSGPLLVLLLLFLLGLMLAAPSFPADGAELWQRLARQWVTFRVVLALLLISFAVATSAYYASDGYWRAMLQFMMNGWPQPFDDRAAPRLPLAVGVFLQTLVTLGVPALLLALFREFRRKVMELNRFIAQRDAYIQSEVFKEMSRLARHNPERSLTEEEYGAAIRRAFQKGAEEWQGLLTEATKADLAHAYVRVYEEPARTWDD